MRFGPCSAQKFEKKDVERSLNLCDYWKKGVRKTMRAAEEEGVRRFDISDDFPLHFRMRKRQGWLWLQSSNFWHAITLDSIYAVRKRGRRWFKTNWNELHKLLLLLFTITLQLLFRHSDVNWQRIYLWAPNYTKGKKESFFRSLVEIEWKKEPFLSLLFPFLTKICSSLKTENSDTSQTQSTWK